MLLLKQIFIIIVIIILIVICFICLSSLHYDNSKHLNWSDSKNTLSSLDDIYQNNLNESILDELQKESIPELQNELNDDSPLNDNISTSLDNPTDCTQSTDNIDVGVLDSLSTRIRNYQGPKLITPRPYPGKDSKGELLCQRVIKEIFPNTIFYKTRPGWLKNPQTGASMEFDIYTHNLEGQNVRLAIEYQGAQHRLSNHPFNSSLEKFDKQRYRDQLKIELCKQLTIILIIVWDDKNTYKKVWNDIVEQLIIYEICPKEIDYK